MADSKELTPVDRLKNAINSVSVQEQFRNALKDNAPLFIASLIDVYSSDKTLHKSDPKTVIMEALKAATLKLPINKGLGYAWIIPYKGKATMQIGYKGYVQLAQRTGYYRYINADCVYEGEIVKIDRLTGEAIFSGEKKSEKAIGYFAYFELLNGFKKSLFWTREEVDDHAKRFAPSYSYDITPWKTDFDKMAKKTMLKALLSTYGLLSVEMTTALSQDVDEEGDIEKEISDNANGPVIDTTATTGTEGAPGETQGQGEQTTGDGMSDAEKADILAQEKAGQTTGRGPNF